MKAKKRKFIIPNKIESSDDVILICEKCGNYKDFKKCIFGNSPFTKEVIYEISKGNTKITEGEPEYEEEIYDDSSGWECLVCGETIVEEVEDYESFMGYISKHVNKDLTWSIEEVDEKNQNSRIQKILMFYKL